MHMPQKVAPACNPSIKRACMVKRDGVSARLRPRVVSQIAVTRTSTARIIQKEKSFQLNNGLPRIQNHCQECSSQVATKVTSVATDIAHSVPIFRNLK